VIRALPEQYVCDGTETFILKEWVMAKEWGIALNGDVPLPPIKFDGKEWTPIVFDGVDWKQSMFETARTPSP
jgi:hypothetical protein